ncbi:MAG: hypothetical protein IJ642_14040 [Oscillospiraceae bacterium]|nr:hypothetical protein [Oscillospiraceae bacterium]MBR1530400.1 hypothetical protein [Oscillospiraceae bacterium]
MSDFQVKLTSNIQQVLDELNRKCEFAMQKIGGTAVDQTVQAIEGNLGMSRAVQTGRLKNSIHYATQEQSGYDYIYFDDEIEWFENSIPKITDTDPVVYIGTEVYYAASVYFGYGANMYKGAREFLKIGLSFNAYQWENILKNELKK